MRKQWTVGLVLILLAFSSALLATETHRFRLPQDAQLQGADLKAGNYTIRLNSENEAEILQNGKVVVTSPVEVQPLDNKSLRNSVLIQAGEIAEIRLKKQRIMIKHN